MQNPALTCVYVHLAQHYVGLLLSIKPDPLSPSRKVREGLDIISSPSSLFRISKVVESSIRILGHCMMNKLTHYKHILTVHMWLSGCRSSMVEHWWFTVWDLIGQKPMHAAQWVTLHNI